LFELVPDGQGIPLFFMLIAPLWRWSEAESAHQSGVVSRVLALMSASESQPHGAQRDWDPLAAVA